MEPDGTEVTTSGEPHQLVYMCRQHYIKKSHMNKKQNAEGICTVVLGFLVPRKWSLI